MLVLVDLILMSTENDQLGTWLPVDSLNQYDCSLRTHNPLQ